MDFYCQTTKKNAKRNENFTADRQSDLQKNALFSKGWYVQKQDALEAVFGAT